MKNLNHFLVLTLFIFSIPALADNPQKSEKDRKPASTGDFVCGGHFSDPKDMEKEMNWVCNREKQISIAGLQPASSIYAQRLFYCCIRN